MALLIDQIALKLEFSEELKRYIRLEVLVHDIGKITIPDKTLFKRGRLTSAEDSETKKQPTATIDIVGHVDRFQTIMPLIESHHDRYDGKDYLLRGRPFLALSIAHDYNWP